MGDRIYLIGKYHCCKPGNFYKFKRDAYVEHEQRQEAGVGDRWYEMQRNIMPSVDSSLVRFKIEMLFSYMGPDGSTFLLNGCHGLVTKVVNKKNKNSTDYLG